MPPKNVKTVRQLIWWEYAKLIAGRAVGDRANFKFDMHTYKKLETGQIHPSSILRENKILCEEEAKCAYCGTHGEYEWDHIIPKSRQGPDTIDNMVRACPTCNASKGARDPFEWYGVERRYEVPRLVLGKFLKLAYEAHEKAGTLDATDLNGDGKLDVLDLGHVFRKPEAEA